MPRKLHASITLNGIFILILCSSCVPSSCAVVGRPLTELKLKDTFQETGPRRSLLSTDTCIVHIFFFGVLQYWKEVSRKKRWVRHILEGTRLDCRDEPCTVRVSYTERPEDIAKADLVIFTNTSPMSPNVWDSLIEMRPPAQKWVMSTQESPPYIPGLKPPERYRNVAYDWSDTYRLDATFPSPYGKYRTFDSDGQDYVRQHRLEALIKGKKKSVAWVASHCDALQWNRTRFVQDLREYIPIDTYGKCGDNPLAWKRKELLRKDLAPYKFYLSLENSCCDQYITEKFWRSLDFGMIPVVVGAPLQNYLDLAPPDSFIHVDQFDSMKKMADYMLEISRSPSKMRKHLLWRLKGEVRTEEINDHILKPMSNSTLCPIVEKLKSTLPTGEAGSDITQDSFDFYGKDWLQSCHSCGKKQWMEPYQTRTL